MRHEDKLDRLDEIADGAKWWLRQLNQLQNIVDEAPETEREAPLQKLEDHASSAVWIVAYMKYSMSQYCITYDIIRESKEDESVLSIDYLTFLIGLCPNIPAYVSEYVENFKHDCRIHHMMRAFIDGDAFPPLLVIRVDNDDMADDLIQPIDEQIEELPDVDLIGAD